MNIIYINKKLKYLILILLIVVALESVFFKYDNCSVCKFKLKEKTINSKDFLELYSSICLVKNKSVSFNNISSSLKWDRSHKRTMS